jgi:hypothetical protein
MSNEAASFFSSRRVPEKGDCGKQIKILSLQFYIQSDKRMQFPEIVISPIVIQRRNLMAYLLFKGEIFSQNLK